MENIINTHGSGTGSIEDFKKAKEELDAEYNEILKIINSTKSREVIEECQAKLVILFEKYQTLAEDLKRT